MTRFPDWRTQLSEYLADTRGQGFRWGKLDCALFVAGAVEAMTGEDLARGWRGYRTEAEGRRALDAKGFGSHVDLVASLLTECHPSEAMPGDVVLTDENALGILQGRLIYCMSPSGLTLLPRDAAARAFHV